MKNSRELIHTHLRHDNDINRKYISKNAVSEQKPMPPMPASRNSSYFLAEGISRGRLGNGELEVSKVCLGTMQYGEGLTFEEGSLQMFTAWENGVNFFDTAEMYPVPQSADTQGFSEVCLGRWIKSAGLPRDQVVVATKVAGPSAQMTWIREGPLDHSAISQAVEQSLTRLGSDHIDLLQLHWPDRYVPMFGDTDFDPGLDYDCFVPAEEQLEAISRLIQQGKVREAGLSNETAWGLMSFTQLADHEEEEEEEYQRRQRREGEGEEDEQSHPDGRGHSSDRRRRGGGKEAGLITPERLRLARVVSVQNAYNLLCRNFDSTLAEVCHREHISLLAYSPLAMGHLSGKYLPQNQGGPSNARLNRYKGQYAEAESRYSFTRPNLMEAVSEYANLAERFGMTPAQLAIQFVMRHPLLGSVVVGATSVEQLDEILGAAMAKPLDAEILAEIDKIHERYPNPTP